LRKINKVISMHQSSGGKEEMDEDVGVGGCQGEEGS